MIYEAEEAIREITEKGFKRGQKIFEENNKVILYGQVEKDFEYVYMEMTHFYKTRLKVERMSGNMDFIPIAIPEEIFAKYLKESLTDKWIKIAGNVRAKMINGRKKLYISVTYMQVYDEDLYGVTQNNNIVLLRGYISSEPYFKVTKTDEKKLASFQFAVNREHGKVQADYVPVVAWNKQARWLKKCKMGDKILVIGRIQSRKFLTRDGNSHEVNEISAIDAY